MRIAQKLLVKKVLLYFLFSSIFIHFSSCTSKEERKIRNSDFNSFKIQNEFNQLDTIVLRKKALSFIKNGDIDLAVKCFSGIGNRKYTELDYFGSIKAWTKAAELSEKLNIKLNTAQIENNLGAAYNALGYSKTSSYFFIKAKKVYDEENIKDQNYWVMHINIGVCYMDLNMLDEAKKYFGTVAGIEDDYIQFLYHLNMTKLSGLEKDREDFYFHSVQSKKFLPKFELFRNVWETIFLEFAADLYDFENANKILNTYQQNYSKKPLYVKLLLNRLKWKNEKELFEPANNFLSYESKIIVDNDLYQTDLYYEIVADYFLSKQDFVKYSYAVKKSIESKDKLREQRNNQSLEDYKSEATANDLRRKNQILEVKNQLNQRNVHYQKIVLIFFIILSISLLILLLLGLKYFKKSRKLKQLELEGINAALKFKQLSENALKDKVGIQEIRINEIMLNISKIAVLKSQIDQFIKSSSNMNISDEWTREIKLLKLNMDSFFTNYRELAVVSYTNTLDYSSIEKLKRVFPTLTEKDTQVIQLILNNFTSKEIAILLSKSEKSIEYYRRQLRLKLGLKKEDDIEQFIISELKAL
jgi:DNA-binding CsgD family transcriptional regulator